MGKDDFVWWVGVVEDRIDPLQLGRCRVRVLGFHTENKVNIPTEKLPWAYPIQPITSAGINGIGTTPLGPVEGTWVFGFFRDGKEAQEPVFMGVLGGIPQQLPLVNVGFNDPNLVYPQEKYLNEPDTNRLARNDSTLDSTDIVNLKTQAQIKDIQTADGNTWEELVTPYAAQYPFNHVTQTESGHIIELDDTPEKERIHVYHKTGTFIEIHPDGSRMTKIIGDDYDITLKDKNLFVQGNINITVNGNANVYTKGNMNLKVDGNYAATVTGNYDVLVEGEVTFKAKTIDLN